jgi:hypothetical protein
MTAEFPAACMCAICEHRSQLSFFQRGMSSDLIGRVFVTLKKRSEQELLKIVR